MSNNIKMPPPVGALVATAGVLVVLRAIKRHFAPVIQAKLSCRCGKVQGSICAKADDSIRLRCYCEDCRNYANFIEKDSSSKESIVYQPCGESRLVQVCKSGVSIDQGVEHLKLSRRAPNTGMFRYYASCCNTPILNTVDFLGYVGVYENNLDKETEKFAGPWCFCPHEAVKTPLEKEALPTVPVRYFLWNLLRYMPWTKSGPLDYSLEPVFWGEAKKQA